MVRANKKKEVRQRTNVCTAAALSWGLWAASSHRAYAHIVDVMVESSHRCAKVQGKGGKGDDEGGKGAGSLLPRIHRAHHGSRDNERKE